VAGHQRIEVVVSVELTALAKTNAQMVGGRKTAFAQAKLGSVCRYHVETKSVTGNVHPDRCIDVERMDLPWFERSKIALI
jgi:hypothetical protein